VEPRAAVPERVTESLELTAVLAMTGAAGAVGAVAAAPVEAAAADTVTPSAFDFALVPAAVVSVAMYP
jgi:hypothetical protein